MRARRPPLFLLFIAVSLLVPAPARAEMPEAGERERQWELARAYARFEAGRFEQALAGFEAAAREPAPPLPAEALRRWGVAASEAGWPLAAYVRLRQFVAVEPEAADREALGQRIARAREALLETAVRQSRIIALAETRPSWDVPGERQVVRLVGQNGRATVEALAGSRVTSPAWEHGARSDRRNTWRWWRGSSMRPPGSRSGRGRSWIRTIRGRGAPWCCALSSARRST
jgi:tetratricopeptide (TPR) repeat protein